MGRRRDPQPSALCCSTPRPRADTEHSSTWTPGRKWPPGEKGTAGSGAQLCRESQPDVGVSIRRWGLRFHKSCYGGPLVPSPGGARPPERGRPTPLRRRCSSQARPLAPRPRTPLQGTRSFPALPGSSGSHAASTPTGFQSGTSHRRSLHETPLPTGRSGRRLRASQAAPDPPLPLPAGGHFRPATAELAEDLARKWPNLPSPARGQHGGVRDFTDAPESRGGGDRGLCPPASQAQAGCW